MAKAKPAAPSPAAPPELLAALGLIKEQPYGARFFKADLHFHTPASEDARGKDAYDFNPFRTLKYPPREHSFESLQKVRALQEGVLRDARLLAGRIVDRMLAEGLGLVAVTDHNALGTLWPDVDDPEGRSMDLAAPTWYELLSDEAELRNQRLGEGQRALCVLPGVEISTNGVHILAVFPPPVPRRRVHFQICDLLTEVGIPVSEFGRNPRVGHASVADTLRLIAHKGGLAIIAHIDGSDQSLLRLFDLTSGAMRATLEDPALFGVEVVDPERLTSVDKKLKEPLSRYFDRVRQEADLDPLAYFQGSDAHDLPTIGKRFSYVKMTAPSFAGLQAAIRAPASRLRLSDLHEPPDSGLYLYGAQIDTPFFGKRGLRFNRHLNCIVGRKECGKSQLLALLEQAVDPDGAPLDGTARVFMDRRAEGRAQLFCFTRSGAEQMLHRLVEEEGGGYRAEALDPRGEEAQALRPRFYREERVRPLIDDPEQFSQFLARFFGPPSAASVKALNEELAPPQFLEPEASPLLVASLGRGRYEVAVNLNFRGGAAELCPFAELSRSMKRLALVGVILVTGRNGPLVIDEPGDHFDNEDIARYLVPLLKQLKDRRQILIATGNANLAINSDPDSYVVVRSERGRCQEIRAGFAIDNDEQRERLILIMEGSKKAFQQRDRRYRG